MSEADTLRMTAEVVDKFSGPLKSLREHLGSIKGVPGARQMREEFEGVGRSVEGLKKGIERGLKPELDGIGLKAIGLVGAFAAVTAALRSFSGSTNDLRRVSSEVGISIERLRAFGALAERAGIDPAAMSAATRTFATNMRDVRAHVGATNTFLLQQDGGVRNFAVQLSKIKDNDLAFVTSLKFLREIPDAVDRARIATALFGSADLGRLGLEDISKLLKEIQEEQGKLPKGSEEAAKANEEAMARMRNQLSGLRDQLGVAVLPAMTALTDAATKFLGENREAITGGIAGFLNGTNWPAVRDGFREIGAALGDIGRIVNGVVSGLGGWKAVTEGIIALWAANKIGNLLGGLSGGKGGLRGLLGPLGKAVGIGAVVQMAEDSEGAYDENGKPKETFFPHQWIDGFNRMVGRSTPNQPYGFDEGMKRWSKSAPARPYEQPFDGESEDDRQSRLLMHPASFRAGGSSTSSSPEEVVYKGVLRALVDFAQQQLGIAGAEGAAGGGVQHAGIRSSGWSPAGAVAAAGRRAAAGASGANAGGAMSPEEWKRSLSKPGSLNSLINQAALEAAGGNEPEARRIASIMQGIRAGEGSHGNAYSIGDQNDGGAYGPWQFNMGKGRLGDVFKRQTGVDPRDPRSIPDMARYTAKWIRDHPNAGFAGIRAVWHGYKGPMAPSPSWGEEGYRPIKGAFTEAPGGSTPLQNQPGFGGIPGTYYPQSWGGRGGEASPVGSFLRGDMPWSGDGGAELSRKARQSGALGGNPNVSGSVHVSLENFPRSVRAKTSADGLFEIVKLNRGRSMAMADEA